MATINRFEDLRIWSRSRRLYGHVCDVSSAGSLAKDFVLRDQFRKAALSVALNIAEGFGRKTRKEFERFLFISHGSLAEVQACLYLARDQGHIEPQTFDAMYKEAETLSKMISSLIKYLRS